MFYFTSDEHYGHANIIKYCNRPFKTTDEMNYTIITNHNSIVKDGDTTIHCGDFTLDHNANYAEDIIHQLNGRHIFIKGSHDRWMEDYNQVLGYHAGYLYERKYNDIYIVACHYAMRVWPRSHYGSIQVYGHSHNNLPPIGKQMDVGVDAHNFFPVSLNQVVATINLNQGVSNDQAVKAS